MTSEQRLHALRTTQESSLRVGLPLEIVGQLDEFLRDYGISEPLADEDLDERVRFVLNRGEAKKFLRVLEARNTAHALGEDTQRVDRDFYNAICSDPLLGVVHSVKRAFILDALAVRIPRRKLLDWLEQRTTNPVRQ